MKLYLKGKGYKQVEMEAVISDTYPQRTGTYEEIKVEKTELCTPPCPPVRQQTSKHFNVIVEMKNASSTV